MKIAISSDLHLKNRTETPDRYSALENILSQIQRFGIQHLILAGDVFDASRQNYADFEMLCRAWPAIHFWVIPGNHDPALSPAQISGANITILAQAEVRQIGDSCPILFLPYEANRTMGERIAEQAKWLPFNTWILIAHGDWLDGLREVNPYETGLYMPLTRKDLGAFKPRKVFLGHIHVATNQAPIYYPGSPCGLDITETGPRRFLIYDTRTDQVTSSPIDCGIIYYDETITLLPLEDEETYIQNSLAAMVQKWGLAMDDLEKVHLRIRANGYSSNRGQLAALFSKHLANINRYKNEEADISAVSASNDQNRSQLAAAVRERIRAQTWPQGPDEPTENDIFQAALATIFGADS